MIMTGLFCACGNGEGKKGETVSPSAVGTEASATSLKDVFKNYFTVGVAINTWQLSDPKDSALIQKHFNSCTMENEMKPENVLDWEASKSTSNEMPAINKVNLEKVLKLASSNGLKLRGHTLIWHNQTPDWLFCKNYDPEAGYVDKKTMLTRMESYIEQVITYCESTYPGVVYAYDVVNEAVGDAGNEFRSDSTWYEIIGEEYFEKAFEYARKYGKDKVKLFYNDYNEYDVKKANFITAQVKKLAEKGYIDGVGMQSHWTMDDPEVDMIEFAIEKYATIPGMEIQLTEIDMHNNDDSEASLALQADRYKEIFEMLVTLKKENRANITNVTFWGLNDGVTWLTNFRKETSYPLLFDADNNPKPVLQSLLSIK